MFETYRKDRNIGIVQKENEQNSIISQPDLFNVCRIPGPFHPFDIHWGGGVIDLTSIDEHFQIAVYLFMLRASS